MTVLEKRKPSTDLIQMIKVAGDSLLSFGELWGTIKQKGGEEGFSEKELQEMLRPYLKQKMDSKKIWYLFNKEEEQERNKQNYQNRTFKQKIDEKKEPEQSQDDALTQEEDFEKWEKDVPVKDSTQFYKEQESIPSEPVGKKELEYMDKIPENEEPTELELANIKIAQLEDALHKTEQFKPATALEGKRLSLDETAVFEFLSKRDNGVNIYYFDNYGRELFSNRILSQLRNSGVKTFKRLYFEV